ncbi:MAG TPA: rhodanese-like domain-containing protein [Candidatus Dormibacteraeota bacterium]
MPRQIFSVDDVKQLIDNGGQLVDVLGREEFEHSHLPGAINIPLKELTETSSATLDRGRPVIVYCNDFG